MSILGKAFGWLKGELSFIVLVAVAAAGAWLYVRGEHYRGERDAIARWAEVTCAATGEGFPATETAKPGQRCAQRVGALVAFKSNTDQLTAQTLAKALADHDARQRNDNQAARIAAEAARNAAMRMEAADADAERTNLVDRDWFAAVNGVAGLRPKR